MEELDYLGWIPCVNGHLDFGLMKVGIKGGFTNLDSTDRNCIEKNFSCSPLSDSHDRRMVLQSKVDWRDSPKFQTDDGLFRVFVTAEVNKSNSMDERCLKGNILIYPLGAEPKDTQSRHNMNVHLISQSINDDDNDDLLGNFNELEKITSGSTPITHFDDDYFFCSIEFEIQPSGLTKLKYNQNKFDNESKFVIARQAFYYLKYSIHTHKHHTTQEDSLTTITPIYHRDATPEYDAGLRLICQLKRELTGLKRIQSTDDRAHPTNDAIGIIAYIESLISSLRANKFISNIHARRELQRFQSTKASFLAQTNKIDHKLSNNELLKSKSKVWLGFIIVSIWGFMNFTYKPLVADKTEISGYFIYAIPFILAIIYYFIIEYYQSKLNPLNNEKLYYSQYLKMIFKMVAPLTIGILAIIYQYNLL